MAGGVPPTPSHTPPPPAFPQPIPLAAHRAKHVAAHDERLGLRQPVGLEPGLLRIIHPCVELGAPAVAAVVAERALLGLVEPGRVSVDRNREITGHLARTCGHRSVLFAVGLAQGWSRQDMTSNDNPAGLPSIFSINAQPGPPEGPVRCGPAR